MPLFVLATSADATARALSTAGQLASREAGSRVVLLVPDVITYNRPFEVAFNRTAALADHYRELSRRADVDATVRVCVCHRIQDIFERFVSEPATVVIAGRRRMFRRTPEQRLERSLRGRGYDVVFVE